MAVKTINGNTTETIEEVQQLSPEALERFKKSHNGMTPEEYARHYTKMTLAYSFRNEISHLVEYLINQKVDLDDEIEKCKNKTSTLASSIRRFIIFLNSTEEGDGYLHEIIDEQIKNFNEFAAKREERAAKEEEKQKVEDEAAEKRLAERREKRQAYNKARSEKKAAERAERKAAQLQRIQENRKKRELMATQA